MYCIPYTRDITALFYPNPIPIFHSIYNMINR